jgi:LmbE family N-acetylglucosaminyl deacetylase
VISPHQDDATLGFAGLILGKRLEGNPVDNVFMTDGSVSHLGHPTVTPTKFFSFFGSSEELYFESDIG